MNRNYRVSGVENQGAGLRSQEVTEKSESVVEWSAARRGLTALLFLLLVTGAAVMAFRDVPAVSRDRNSAPPVASASSSAPIANSSLKALAFPMFFEENQGQTDPQVKFLARGAGYTLFLTADDAVLKLQKPVRSQESVVSQQPTSASVIRMRLAGVQSNARISGVSRLPGRSAYFIGNDPRKWRRDVPQFGRVEYSGVYSGIDLAYYGNQGQLEYDFRVAPGADPSSIAMSFEGAQARLESGDLVLTTSSGDIRFHAPHIYQAEGATEKPIAGGFRQLAGNRIGFEIGAYDKSRDLIIDPTLLYATYLGGTGGGSTGESNVQVAVGTNSNIYLAGSTTSTDFPFPIPGNAAFSPVQAANAGQSDVFVAELVPNATPATVQLIYATYLGGSQSETLAGLAVDPSLNVYVAGTTSSPDFPTGSVLAPFQASASGTHGFLAKLGGANGQNGDLSQLAYSTYLAGNGTDLLTGMTIDGKGNAFVTGTTTSTDSATGFPSTTNAYQPCPFAPGTTCPASGPPQFFASEVYTGLSASGAASMIYSTYFGGGNPANATSVGGGIAVDASGNFYITGTTNMQASSVNGGAAFPIVNAQDPCLNLCTTNTTSTDGFVAKINPNRTMNPGLVYSTYLGGSADDAATAIAVDATGSAYITGTTNSPDFVPGSLVGAAFQECLNNTQATPPCTASTNQDAFVARLGSVVSGIAALSYATYIGGSGNDSGAAVVVDSNSNIHLTGSTGSGDLPVTGGLPQQAGYGGGNDAFVAQINPGVAHNGAGNTLVYLGGSGFDQGTGIAVDATNNAYVAGVTNSANFPVVNPFQGYAGNGSSLNAFVAQVGVQSTLAVSTVSGYPSPTPAPAGNSVTFKFTVTNNGPDNATNVAFTATVPSAGISSPAATVTGGTCGNVLTNATIVCTIASLPASEVQTMTVTLTPTIPVINQNITVSATANVPGGAVTSPIPESVEISDYTISVSPSSQTVTAGGTTSYTVTVTPVPSYSATVTMSVANLPSATASTWNPSTAQVVLSGTGPGTITVSLATTPRPVTGASLLRSRPLYATLLPVGGISLLGIGLGAGFRRRKWLAAALLGLVMALIALQPACSSSSAPVTANGGTPAGLYTLKFTGSSGSVSHTQNVSLQVN